MSEGSKAPALSVRRLTVDLRASNGWLPVVRGLDFDLAPGVLTGLAGESGSGKTLTALALMGLADRRSFRVGWDHLAVAGTTLEPGSERAFRVLRGPHIAMVFQDPATALDPVFTVGDQLRRVLRRRPGLSAREARDRALGALEAVGFPDPEGLARRHPHELSGGMRQLCVIAMAQALRPAVLLADEPTTALDAATQSLVLHGLDRLAREDGTAVLLISHDLRLLTQFAGPVMVMYHGRIVEETTGRGLFEAPRHPYSAGLLNALPRLEPHPGGPSRPIPGDVPPVGEVLPGCAFAPRCARADVRCGQETPNLGHAPAAGAACHHPLDRAP